MSSDASQIVLLFVCALAVLNLVLTLRLAGDERRRREDLVRPLTRAIGEPVPQFAARDLDGNEVGPRILGDGDWLLVFAGSECEACRQELPLLVQLFGTLQLIGVPMVVVGLGSEARLRQMVAEFAVVMPVVVMAPAMLRAYNPRSSTPFYCYVDGDGLLQASGDIGNPAWQKLCAHWSARGQRARADLRRFM